MRRVLLAGCLLLVAGCTGNNGSDVLKPSRTPLPPATTIPAPPSTALSPTTGPFGSGPVVASGHGWSGRHLDGPTFPAGNCHGRGTATVPLPDPRCTPGATDAAVTGGTIGATICVRGYTATVRPPASVTGPAKRESAKEYGFTGAGEYDHLIPLELGGASDTRNLWLEPGAIPNAKDKVENTLKAMVCAHKITLVEAQRAIAGDWATALTVVAAQSLN